jgi:prolyl-tRNA editing enzyme YbaK/EbsC (Cys-tRNA(Pro) deacylase)
MPPFGHRQTLRTLVAPSIPRLDLIFGGGGDVDAMMRLTSAELLRVTGAEITDVSEKGVSCE